MLKPYAQSTLKKKYRATGIDAELIFLVRDYINACANFYYILELEEAWNIISKRVHISRAQFDALIPLFCRDDSLDCYIVPESELYLDGSDELYIISILCLLEHNEECDLDQFIKSLDDIESYHGPAPLIENWDRLDPLYMQRLGKPIFVPDDLLEYADEDYYEETPQTEAMERFLRERIRKPADAHDIDDDEYVDNAVWSCISEMINIIRDITVSPSDNMQRYIEALEYIGMPRLSMKETQRFLDLYQDLSNHTRLPVNKGHTPEELYALSRPAKAPKTPGPNDPCPCGSGKKYKKCCGRA